MSLKRWGEKKSQNYLLSLRETRHIAEYVSKLFLSKLLKPNAKKLFSDKIYQRLMFEMITKIMN